MSEKIHKRLLVIPTFNEAQNIKALVSELLNAELESDILFVDDSSPDGTGDIIAEIASECAEIRLLRRPFKSGIGSAQRDGILLGYREGYEEVATMDADLTHAPEDLKRFFNQPDGDVIIGSRFKEKGSLPGWSLWRLFLTHVGHILTRICLGISQDATGGLRVYRTSRIPKRVFELSQSDGYAFLFESLLIIVFNGLWVKEVPICLPGRIIGQSKLRFADLLHSVRMLFQYFIVRNLLPERIRLVDLSKIGFSGTGSKDAATWDSYWGCRLSLPQLAYDVLASFYRRFVIRPPFELSIRTNFAKGARLLHAGCGTGQVDSRLMSDFQIVGLDHSLRAIELFVATNGQKAEAKLGSVFKLPFTEASFQGVYNLGVMEHFTREEIIAALREFHRVLTPDGKIILWWPPERGTSVIILKVVSAVLKLCSVGDSDSLFPAECSRIKSRENTRELLSEAGFILQEFKLGIGDLYSQVLVTATKSAKVNAQVSGSSKES
jgi:dolichol-phosphate mannosyltransferase